jgi:hypothetical protein
MDFRGKTLRIGDKSKAQCNWDGLKNAAKQYDEFIITLDKWDEEKEISRQQMAYLHAVVFPVFAKEMHCSLLMAELTLKRCCGEQWLVKRIDKAEIILSKTILSVKQCNKWLENIWDWCAEKNIHIPEPDKDWRKKPERQVMPMT